MALDLLVGFERGNRKRTKLSDCDVEAELYGLPEAVDGTSDNERVDILSGGTNDDAQQRDNVATDEEPSSTKQIR